MRRILMAAGAALVVLSGTALAQGHGGGGGGPGGGGPGGGGPPVGVPGGGPGGGIDLPTGGPTATLPRSDNANANATGQNRGQSGDELHAQTDSHASVRAHERTGADVDHSAAASGAGLATRTFRVGQHVSGNAKFFTDLSAIPDAAKAQIPSQYMTDAFRFIYQADRIYVVDSGTSKVVTVVNLMP